MLKARKILNSGWSALIEATEEKFLDIDVCRIAPIHGVKVIAGETELWTPFHQSFPPISVPFANYFVGLQIKVIILRLPWQKKSRLVPLRHVMVMAKFHLICHGPQRHAIILLCLSVRAAASYPSATRERRQPQTRHPQRPAISRLGRARWMFGNAGRYFASPNPQTRTGGATARRGAICCQRSGE